MKYVIVVILFLLIGCTSLKNNSDCDRFRLGTFYNKSEIDNAIDTKITRTEEYQIEEYYQTGAVCKFKVKWIDQCSYKLIFDSGNTACNKTGEIKDVIVRIIETKVDSYIVEGWVEGSSLKIKSEIVKNK